MDRPVVAVRDLTKTFAGVKALDHVTLEIAPGDALFVCSDGVFEALNDKGDLFSIERLGRLLREATAAEPLEMVRVIKEAVDTFTGTAPRTDDVTVLALRWQPAQAANGEPIAWARP